MNNFVSDWFRWLYESTGINYSVFFDSYDWSMFVHGLSTTVQLSIISLFTSLLIGLIGVWVQRSNFAPGRWIVRLYIEIFRNTPPLVQIYFFYFGIGTLIPSHLNTTTGQLDTLITPFGWALITLTLFAGAFNIEIFRSGIDAVPAALKEAGESLGYNKFGVFCRIVLPLSIRICMPSLTNNLVNLIKTTEIAYAISVTGLLYTANSLWSINFNVPEMMNVLLFCYLSLVGILVIIMSVLERWLTIPGYNIKG